MPFPTVLDFDKIATIALAEVTYAINGWSNGFPKDEVALMNRITERLIRRRRGCDVGINEPITMYAQLATLHRQGPRQTDLYGSDLALTVWINRVDFLKTAFFQFKKSSDFQASFERHQLLDAQENKSVGQRSFVIVVDETRTGIRIKAVDDILSEFDNTQHTKSFDTSNWTFLTQWLWGWLSCDIGPLSKRKDARSVESLLQQYVIAEKWVSPWGVGRQDILDGYLPARAWLNMLFVGSEKELTHERLNLQ